MKTNLLLKYYNSQDQITKRVIKKYILPKIIGKADYSFWERVRNIEKTVGRNRVSA